MKKHVLKAALTVFLIVSTSPAYAFYSVVEVEKLAIPSYELIGTVPLVQIGRGDVGKIKSMGKNRKLSQAFSRLIPKDFNYYVSKKVNMMLPANWNTGKEQNWVKTLDEVAQKSECRVLIDWTFKSVLVVGLEGDEGKQVYANPREYFTNTAPLLKLPPNHSLRKVVQ